MKALVLFFLGHVNGAFELHIREYWYGDLLDVQVALVPGSRFVAAYSPFDSRVQSSIMLFAVSKIESRSLFNVDGASSFGCFCVCMCVCVCACACARARVCVCARACACGSARMC